MFRLRKLLEWKESLEKEALAQRVAFESRAARYEAEAERLRTVRWGIPEEPEADGEDAVRELVQWARYADGLRRREESLRVRLSKLRGEVDEKVAAHLELRREVEGLRRLEESHRLARRRKHEKAQQEAIDDVANRRKFPVRGTDFRSGSVGGSDVTATRRTETPPENDFRPSRGKRP